MIAHASSNLKGFRSWGFRVQGLRFQGLGACGVLGGLAVLGMLTRKETLAISTFNRSCDSARQLELFLLI